MRLLGLLIVGMLLVGCDNRINTLRGINSGSIVKTTKHGECRIIHIDKDPTDGVPYKVTCDDGTSGHVSNWFLTDGKPTTEPTTELAKIQTGIPKDLLELRCKLDGKEIHLERRETLKTDITKFKTGEICTLKKVSLKYE